MAPPSVVETKLNAGAHLQTFPFLMIPRSFPYSNAFIAKWRSQSLSFKKLDEHTDKQTWHGDRGGPYLSCTSKTCLPPTHSFVTRGRRKFGVTRTPLNLTPHNSETPRANATKFQHLTQHETAYKRWEFGKIAQGIRHCGAFICRNFGKILVKFSVLGAPHPHPCIDWGKFDHAKFHPNRCNVSPLRGEKPQNRPPE